MSPSSSGRFYIAAQRDKIAILTTMSAVRQAKVKTNKLPEKGSTPVERGIYRVNYPSHKGIRAYLKFKRYGISKSLRFERRRTKSTRPSQTLAQRKTARNSKLARSRQSAEKNTVEQHERHYRRKARQNRLERDVERNVDGKRQTISSFVFD